MQSSPLHVGPFISRRAAMHGSQPAPSHGEELLCICKFLNSLGTRAGLGYFLYGLEEEAMKKLAFVFAAIAVAALTGANAEELGVRVAGDRDMYRDRDL